MVCVCVFVGVSVSMPLWISGGMLVPKVHGYLCLFESMSVGVLSVCEVCPAYLGVCS